MSSFEGVPIAFGPERRILSRVTAIGAGHNTRIDPIAEAVMCRNIRTLFNFEPPATEREIREASLQFVRKLSGFNAPSHANAAVFDQAVDEVARTASRMMAALQTNAVPRNREVEAAKAKARSALRFGA